MERQKDELKVDLMGLPKAAYLDAEWALRTAGSWVNIPLADEKVQTSVDAMAALSDAKRA